MKILMTGGGTAGHVIPNIALIPELKKLGFSIEYMGTENGIERTLIEDENIPYHSISAGKLRRYLDVENVKDVFKVGKGFMDALIKIRKIKPNIIFSKGGFVSSPVVWAAWANKIPVIIHESDISPGLANKISIPFAKKVCCTFPETLKYLPEEKVELTGTPVRKSIYEGDMNKGLDLCGFNDKKPVILIIGGSLGSESINSIVRGSLDDLLCNFQICHLCGKGKLDKRYENKVGYKQFEYVTDDLAHLFKMSDLIISRAGANTLFEILELKKPNILIPLSKKASRGDQILNANSFQKQGFSNVIFEEDMTKGRLVTSVNNTYKEKKKFIRNMENSNYSNGIDKVIEVILKNM